MKKKTNKDTTLKACSKCKAICCRNLAMTIGKPENKKEIQDLKWQLHFDTVKVYIHKGRWHQLVEGTCMYLSDDSFCTIYEKRSITCRKHNPPDCELYGEFYDIMFETPDDLDRYFEKKRRKRLKARKK